MLRPASVLRTLLVTAVLLLAALTAGLVYLAQPIGWRSSGPRLDGVDPRRLEAHVRMLSETLAPRHWKRQDNLDRAAVYVASRLGEAGARVTEQAYSVPGAGQYRNDLVSFTLEEPPYYDTEWMGSHVHAAALRREGAVVRAMVALEMIGCFTDAPGSQRLPHPVLRLVYPSTGNFVA